MSDGGTTPIEPLQPFVEDHEFAEYWRLTRHASRRDRGWLEAICKALHEMQLPVVSLKEPGFSNVCGLLEARGVITAARHELAARCAWLRACQRCPELGLILPPVAKKPRVKLLQLTDRLARLVEEIKDGKRRATNKEEAGRRKAILPGTADKYELAVLKIVTVLAEAPENPMPLDPELGMERLVTAPVVNRFNDCARDRGIAEGEARRCLSGLRRLAIEVVGEDNEDVARLRSLIGTMMKPSAMGNEQAQKIDRWTQPVKVAELEDLSRVLMDLAKDPNTHASQRKLYAKCAVAHGVQVDVPHIEARELAALDLHKSFVKRGEGWFVRTGTASREKVVEWQPISPQTAALREELLDLRRELGCESNWLFAKANGCDHCEPRVAMTSLDLVVSRFCEERLGRQEFRDFAAVIDGKGDPNGAARITRLRRFKDPRTAERRYATFLRPTSSDDGGSPANPVAAPKKEED